MKNNKWFLMAFTLVAMVQLTGAAAFAQVAGQHDGNEACSNKTDVADKKVVVPGADKDDDSAAATQKK